MLLSIARQSEFGYTSGIQETTTRDFWLYVLDVALLLSYFKSIQKGMSFIRSNSISK